MAGVDFDSVLQISLFVLALFYIGVICKQFGVSPIIGEIITGIVLGPNVLNIVPFTEFFQLAGVFGVVRRAPRAISAKGRRHHDGHLRLPPV